MDRRGLTLVETLVTVAIFAVLVGLLLPAVQRIREVALRTRSSNNLKQIVLAAHHFASANQERLPMLVGNLGTPTYRGTLLSVLIPYTELGNPYVQQLGHPTHVPFPVPFYVSPADPSLTADSLRWGACSYPANAQVFRDRPSLAASIADGTASTIAFAEHYASTARTIYAYQVTDIIPTTHRATFADRSEYPFPGYDPLPGYDDVYPITIGGRTVGSARGRTFQVSPPVDQCDPTLAQTPHPGGMLVAMVDGSVRTIAPDVSETTYWSLVTPNGGETLGSGW